MNHEDFTVAAEAAAEGFATSLLERFSDTIDEANQAGFGGALEAAIQGAGHVGFLAGYIRGYKAGKKS